LISSIGRFYAAFFLPRPVEDLFLKLVFPDINSLNVPERSAVELESNALFLALAFCLLFYSYFSFFKEYPKSLLVDYSLIDFAFSLKFFGIPLVSL
jgi:hypothetical protein